MSIFYGVFSEILYLLLFFVEPIRRSIGETGNVLKNDTIYLGIVCVFAVLTVVYIQVFKDLLEKLTIKKILFFFVLFQITLLFIKPVGSDDVFSYISKARVLSIHHQNPYIVPYGTLQDAFSDKLVNYWSGNVAVYGPVFMLYSGFITLIGENNLYLQVFLFKFFAIVANIGATALLYKLTKNKKAVYLYTWNPFLLYVFALDGHNDVYLLFFLLLSIYFFTLPPKFKNYFLAVLSFLFTILIKYFSIAVAPFFTLFLYKRSKKERSIKQLLLIGIITILIAIAFYLPFWDGPAPFRRIFELSHMEGKSTSPFILITVITLTLLGVPEYFKLAATEAKIVFTSLYTLLFVWGLNSKGVLLRQLVIKYLYVFALFFFVFSVWFLPWYSSIVSLLIILYFGLTSEKDFPKFLFGLTFLQLVLSVVVR